MVEAMAMGFSTQTSPFKPSCPHVFWVSSSCLRSPSMPSRCFWASPRKALQSNSYRRKEDCTVHNVAGPSTSMIVFSSSLQFGRGSSYSTMSFDEKYRLDDMESYLLPTQWKLEVPMRGTNRSMSVARMLPDLPNQIGSRGNSFSGALGSPQRHEEEKKQGASLGTNPSSVAGKCWLEEKNKLREMRMAAYVQSKKSCSDAGNGTIMFSGLKGWQDSSADNNPKYFADSCYGDASGERALQSPLDLGYISRDQINLQLNMPAHKHSSEFSVKNEGNASFVPELIRSDPSSSLSTFSEVNHAGNNSKGTTLPSRQHPKNSPEPNAGNRTLRSSTGKRYSVDPLVPRISTPPRKSVNRQEKYSGNGKGHAGFAKGSGFQMPSSAEQKYTRNTNMSNNNVGVYPSHRRKERNSSSTQKSPNNIQSKESSGELSVEGRKINSSQLDCGATDSLQKGLAGINVVNEACVKPHERLLQIYDKVLVVDNISKAKEIVKMLTNQYRHCVHACDTEVANIDVKQETPVDHGEIICFSIYAGPEANFGEGKSCIWVDVLDGGGKSLMDEFAIFFEDPSIKKVWHNYSFDKHIIENYGFTVSGFHADTMHMARLWDSSRRTEGGYSLEALTSDPKVCCDENLIGKISMKTIFGRKKVKKDGSEGKLVTIPPVEELQREERKPWICYSALDSMSTLKLYESMKSKLSQTEWKLDGSRKGSMLDFYEKYWRPFGELLVEMETEGMLVDRAYLAEMEKVARAEQQVAANRFRSWASKYCPDAKYMNVGSDAQLRQLFFGGIKNSKDPNESLPEEREFKIPNVEKVIEEGKKAPTKFRNIKLCSLVSKVETEMYTATGWPSVSGDALKTLAGKVSADFDFTDELHQSQLDDNIRNLPKSSGAKVETESAYGTAYAAFGGGQKGKEACHAIAALCEVCSIDSLISNFILPLQGNHISGKNGRIHCSLNINTETGRLSARRPNLQNQPALEKDRYKIRQAFVAAPGNSLIVADYGQLELRILAHLANCKSMLDAFEAGGDFHSRTAMNMYPHIREAVEKHDVLLEWHPQPGEEKPPVPLLKDAFGSERRKAKMLNFSIAYGKTPVGLARDWKVSVKEAKETVERWYNGRQEVREWQEKRKKEARQIRRVHTLLGRARVFPSMDQASPSQKGHIERAAINTPVQGSAADVAMCAMLQISKNTRLKELGWRLLLQVHDEVILEGPTESAEEAKAIVVECMSKPFDGGKNILSVDLAVDAKCAGNWYLAK